MSDEGEFWEESPEAGPRIAPPDFGEEEAWREEILASGVLLLDDGSIFRLSDREWDRLRRSTPEGFSRILGALDLSRRHEPLSQEQEVEMPELTETDSPPLSDASIHPEEIPGLEGDQGSLFSEELEEEFESDPDRPKLARKRTRRETTPSLFDEVE